MARVLVLECETNGDYFRMVRAARGISVKDLAKNAGISENTVYLVESDKVTPSPEMERKIRRALSLG